MFRLDYLIALSLLTAPPDSPVPHTDPKTFVAVVPCLQSLSLEWEILDPREVNYILTRPEDFSSDLNLLRRRRAELCEAPPMMDATRFPNRELAAELMSFNRAYRQHLGIRQPVELANWWELREALQETDHLYQIWENVRDARCDYYFITVRRQSLKKLRDLIGNEDYYAGVLPPHVPLWRFHEIDK